LGIAPLRVIVTKAHAVGQVTITSSEERPLTLQVEPQAWAQVDGHDVETPTNRLVVVPPIVVVGPHATQVVRLALRTSAPGGEQAFRLWITEVANQTQTTAKTVQVVRRFSIPLFAEPATLGDPHLAFELVPTGGKRTELMVTNSGDRFARLRNVRLVTAAGTVFSTSEPIYVLAGNQRRVAVTLAPPGGTLVVRYQLDAENVYDAPVESR
jgi:fimbrial chaperone protein